MLLGFTGLYWVLHSLAGFYLVFTGFSWVSKVESRRVARCYRVLLGFTLSYLILPSFNRFYRIFFRVLLGVIGFFWVLMDFT